jgi:hypothetical protein
LDANREFAGGSSRSAALPPLTVYAVTPNFVASVPKFGQVPNIDIEIAPIDRQITEHRL